MTFSPPQEEAPPKILIVEDEGIIADNIASRLRRSGYHVAGIADSSEEALARVSETRPDLVLMDIRIKGALDGIETTRKLLETFDVPVIYLTAHTDPQTIDRAKRTGVFGFLTKPIDHRTLATTIEMATHRHRAEREIRNQRAWMATALRTMADGMIVIDRDRRVQFLNGPAETLTGWPHHEARGQDIADVLSVIDDSGEILTGLLSPPAQPGPPSAIPPALLAVRRSGERFPVEGDIAGSVDGERIAGAVITFRDATSRQARENEARQQLRMQAVGRLAAGVAHDFNNLLFIMLGYTEEMLRTAAEHEVVPLTEIKKAGDNAAKITQQLLQFSRNESPEKGDIDLNHLIRDTEELFRRLAGRSIKWQFRLGENLALVHANESQIKQVLMNLVANARDAMTSGGEITIETANESASSVMLSVADTGNGISRETSDRLFEPFFTTKAAGSGTGLGLSIVQSIITDLGGSIQVDSEPGRGAAFRISIPAIAAPRPATVLLADDQGGIRSLLREYLTRDGYLVLEAASGDEAVHLAEQSSVPVDLLITDMTMPGRRGLEVSETLTGRWPQMKTIFISGYSREFDKAVQDVPAGARFLRKPFSRAELLDSVRELLGTGKSITASAHAAGSAGRQKQMKAT
jgi:PAS domain S-box-containing protein